MLLLIISENLIWLTKKNITETLENKWNYSFCDYCPDLQKISSVSLVLKSHEDTLRKVRLHRVIGHL